MKTQNLKFTNILQLMSQSRGHRRPEQQTIVILLWIHIGNLVNTGLSIWNQLIKTEIGLTMW